MNFNLNHCLLFIKKDFRENFSSNSRLILEILGMVFRITFIYFLSEFIFARNFIYPYNIDTYFIFIFSGIIFLEIITNTLPSIPKTIIGFKNNGIFEEIIQLRSNKVSLLLYTSLYSGFYTLIKAFIYYFLALLFFSIEMFPTIYLPIFGVICIIFITSCISMSLIISSLAICGINPFFLISIYSLISIFFGGIFFPIELLPGLIQPVSSFLPMTYSVDLARSLHTGDLSFLNLENLFILSAFAIIKLFLGTHFVKIALKHARKKGKLLNN